MSDIVLLGSKYGQTEGYEFVFRIGTEIVRVTDFVLTDDGDDWITEYRYSVESAGTISSKSVQRAIEELIADVIEYVRDKSIRSNPET